MSSYTYIQGKVNISAEMNTVFQVMRYILTNRIESTPFHVMVVQAVHSLIRSKELVTALNHHEISVSHNAVKQIDVDLAEQIITIGSDNRIPLPPVFETTSPLNGAMDNFDCNESIPAGACSTHDTILVLSKCSQ